MVDKVQGSVLSCHGVCYQVPQRVGCCRSSKKQVLHSVDAIFKPGMNAILGPTGSGKSSLLDILAGRKDPAGLSGQVLLDGQLQPNNFKCMSGYVTQEDIVMGTLTVRENLMFSASLRLPRTLSVKERNQRVENVLHELGLGKVADSKVGTEFLRGVSGGEKKRCNIGMELITQPGVLFLDEPTTGLDASTANAVMCLLHKLGTAGRTIIFSIHQPRYSIFRLFDQLILLGLGRTMYIGPTSSALEYFSSIGYDCEEHDNPSDFFLDVVNGDNTAAATHNAKVSRNGEPGAVAVDIDVAEADKKDLPVAAKTLSETLYEKFSKSSVHDDLQNELKPILENFKGQRQSEVKRMQIDGEYPTNFCQQFGTVSARCFKNLIRSPQASVMQVGTMVLFAILVGALYWQIDDNVNPGLQNRVGAFFFIIMNMIFGNMSGVEIFLKERALFIHENVSGYYRVSAYFFAKIVSDVIPMRTIPTTLFALISYFMIGLRTTPEGFFIMLVTLYCVAICAAAVAFAVSASVNILSVATLTLALAYVNMMVFGGLLVNLDSIVDWLEWIKYLSLFRYGLTALSINELNGLELCKHSKNGTLIACDTSATEEYLETVLGAKYEGSWTLWQNHVALLSLSFLFFVIGYVQLRRINKLK